MTQTARPARPTRLPIVTIACALVMIVAGLGLGAPTVLADLTDLAWTLFGYGAGVVRWLWAFLIECATFPFRTIGA